MRSTATTRSLLVSALPLWMLLVQGAEAGVVLDQNHDTFPPPVTFTTGPVDRAQSYTAGVSGVLDSVALYINQVGADRSLIVEVRATLASVPLGSVEIPAASIPPISNGFFTIDFSGFAIPQTAGTSYVIVMKSGVGTVFSVNLLGTASGDYYPNGVGYQTATTGTPLFAGDADYGFRTYVAVPDVPTLKPVWQLGLVLCVMAAAWALARSPALRS